MRVCGLAPLFHNCSEFRRTTLTRLAAKARKEVARHLQRVVRAEKAVKRTKSAPEELLLALACFDPRIAAGWLL